MSQISWKNPGARDTLYAMIRMVTGVCNTREYMMTKEELQKVQEGLRATGFPLPPEDKSGAIGMQHRWCMTTQRIKDAGQLGLVMVNRLAAIRSNYLTIDFAALAFEENGFLPAASIKGLLQAHKAGILTQEELIVILNTRKSHPLFLEPAP